MKYRIVNGDEFGASHGIKRGIIEAFGRNISPVRPPRLRRSVAS